MSLEEILNSTQKTFDFQKILERNGSRLDKMLFQLKWPPPGHLSAILLDRISLGFEKGQLNAQDVDDIFVHF
jgi:hypothetical protein